MRKGQDGISGSIYLDGAVPSRATVKLRTSYVQQDDVHLATATVRETLLFSAALRLPAAVSLRARTAFVEQVMAIEHRRGLQMHVEIALVAGAGLPHRIERHGDGALVRGHRTDDHPDGR